MHPAAKEKQKKSKWFQFLHPVIVHKDIGSVHFYYLQITNQMIETCKQYITCRFKETIWSQERSLVRDRLTHCINLNKTYRETYLFVKNQPFLPDAEQFNFSENYVFGKFDTFCKRLHKIIAMFDLMEDYNHLFAKRMEGLLLGEGKDA